MNDQVRGYMSQLFEPLNPQLDRFCRAVCKQGRRQVFFFEFIIKDAQSQYFQKDYQNFKALHSKPQF